MPRDPKSILLLLLLLLSTSVLIFPFVRYGYGLDDGLNCALTTGFHKTHFAAGYSDRTFSSIRPGMTTNEVLRILGEPLDRKTWSQWPEGYWNYSQAAPSSPSDHYHVRNVRFAQDGLVSEVYKGFYFD